MAVGRVVVEEVEEEEEEDVRGARLHAAAEVLD